MKTITTALTIFSLLLVAAPSLADDLPPKYSVQCTARQQNKLLLIKFAVTEERVDGKTEVLSRPYIQMNDGQRADISIGKGSDDAADKDKKGADPFSGIQIAVLKAVGSDEVIYTASLVQKDLIIWAVTGTSRIEIAPATQPAVDVNRK